MSSSRPRLRGALRWLCAALGLAIGPLAIATVALAPEAGWHVEYHGSDGFDSAPLLVTREDTVKLDGIESHAVHVSREHFAVRWRGWIEPQQAVQGHIHAKHRGTLRVRIDGDERLPAATTEKLLVRTVPFELDAGPHEIVIEYQPSASGQRGLVLRWSAGESKPGPLPTEQLTPGPPARHRARVLAAQWVSAHARLLIAVALGLLICARLLRPVAPSPTRSSRRRGFFIVVMMLAFYGLTEGMVLALMRATVGPAFTVEELGGARRRLLAREHGPASDEQAGEPNTAGTALGGLVMVHPFLGYVMAPTEEGTNAYGFGADPGGRFFYDDDDDVVLAITGGSYAQQIFHYGQETLARRLEAHPSYAGKRVRVISLAIFGYRQPQQIAAVSYYLWLGGDLDIVVNIDGFNEIANEINHLPHLSGQMHPIYPSPNPWVEVASGLPGTQVLAVAGRIQLLRERRMLWARATEPFSFSVTVNALWKAVDARLERELATLGKQLATPVHKLTRAQSGPAGEVPPAQVDAFTTRLWAGASRQLAELGAGSGDFRYLHLLQPNQYVPDSKSLSPGERKNFFDEHGANAANVRRGYPMLQEAGEQLRAEGVAFHDLTGIYETVDTTLYSDACCHVNRQGGEIMAEAIADLILDAEAP